MEPQPRNWQENNDYVIFDVSDFVITSLHLANHFLTDLAMTAEDYPEHIVVYKVWNGTR